MVNFGDRFGCMSLPARPQFCVRREQFFEPEGACQEEGNKYTKQYSSHGLQIRCMGQKCIPENVNKSKILLKP